MKKFVMLGLFLAGVIGVVALAGCGDSAGTPTNGTGPNEKQKQKEKPPSR